MYPLNYFELFPPFPRGNDVFVAVSFHSLFSARVQNVIRPAILDAGLSPLIVSDATRSGTITTEIIEHIGKSKLIFADISEASPGVRNANVMYELGLAHAVRRPEELVVFRSDSGQLPFDIAAIRVNNYQPDIAPEDSRKILTHSILAAINEQKSAVQIAVTKALRTLDPISLRILSTALGGDYITVDEPKTVGEDIAYPKTAIALGRLLDLGLVYTEVTKVTKEYALEGVEKPLPARIKITELGRAVLRVAASEWGLSELASDPEFIKAVRDKYGPPT